VCVVARGGGGPSRAGVCVCVYVPASEDFWALLTSVLIQDLSWDTRSRHAGGGSARGPLQGGGERGLNGAQTARLCHTLRCHAIVLEILSIEMHRGLRPLGAGQGPLRGDGSDGVVDGTGSISTHGGGRGGGAEGSRAAAEAVEGFIRKNIEAYFGCWTSTYTLFSLNPRLTRTAKTLAAEAKVDLDGHLAVPMDERVPGDGFLYDIPGLERLVRLAPHDPGGDGPGGVEEGAQLVLRDASPTGTRATSEPSGVALRLACEAANRNWSLAEAEAVVLRAFRVFVEVCVLRRQPGYQPGPQAPPIQASGNSSGGGGGVGGAGGGDGDGDVSGGVSPARTPVVASRGFVGGSGGGGGGVGGFGMPAGWAGAGGVVASGGSDFLGDKRSFAMVKIAAHRLAGEKRKGWAVVNVVAEMCEALVSMLHHQLHEVVQKALDPRRSVVRRRDPSLGRLSRVVTGQMGYDACDQTLRTLAPALESLFDVAPLSRVLDMDEGAGGVVGASNAISRATTISLCLRVRLRLLTAGLLLLRAAGGTAEEAAAAAGAAKEGGVGGGGGGVMLSVNVSSGAGGGAGAAAGGGDAEDAGRLSQQARIKLLRRASGTLAELDVLEETLRGHRGGGNRGRSGNGFSTFSDGGVEAEGDRTLRANLAGTCVSIMEEMTVPRGYMGGVGAGAAGGGGAGWEFARGAGGMAYEVERIVEEEKVRGGLL
ncbi:unnamed protein product, partial [Laminaria digitata]